MQNSLNDIMWSLGYAEMNKKKDFLHKRSVVRSFQYVYYISSSAIVRNIRGVRYIGRKRSHIEVTGRRINCISKHVIDIKLSF